MQSFVHWPVAEKDQVSLAVTVMMRTAGKSDGSSVCIVFLPIRGLPVRDLTPYPASRHAATNAIAARATSEGVAPGR